MSYDLYFKGRRGPIEADRFRSYFEGRRHYKVNAGEAVYENESTWVFCVFQWDRDFFAENETPEDGFPDLRQYGAFFNLNFARPSFFGLEAVPEVTAFVNHFDLVIYDPQLDTSEGAEYDAGALLNCWSRGNRAACSIPEMAQHLRLMPGHRLREIWEWNRRAEDLQNELEAADKFVPKILLIDFQNSVRAIGVWPDGIPIAFPPVDGFLVQRQTTGLFGTKKDMTYCEMAQAREVFAKYGDRRPDGITVLNYDRPPADVQSFIRKLPRMKHKLKGVRLNQVVELESTSPEP